MEENKKANNTPAISLPKGGGAISGIGETFQPNLFSGTGNFSIPIATTPERNGFGPQLALQYSTGNGNGPFGLGWQLSIPRISRKTEKGIPRYRKEDTFVMSGAEDLVKVLKDDGTALDIDDQGVYKINRYRPRTEGLFVRIERWSNKNDPKDVHWRATTKENNTSIYGKSAAAKLFNYKKPEHIYEWLLEETFDTKGNHIFYEYIKEEPNLKINAVFENNRDYNQIYIRRILYGNTPESLDNAKKVGLTRFGTDHENLLNTKARHYLFEVLFDYGDIPENLTIPYDWQEKAEGSIPLFWPSETFRKDPFSSYRTGFEIRTLRLCKRVLMLHHFKEGELIDAPLVKSTNFTYKNNKDTKLNMLTEANVVGYRKDQNDSFRYLSKDLPPVSFTYSEFKPKEQKYQSVQAKGNDFPPAALNNPDFTLMDIHGNGLPDILQTTGNRYYCWQNLGNGEIDRRHPQHTMPAGVVLSNQNVAVGDMGGDGLPDLIVEAPPISGFYEATPDGNWKSFKKFETLPSFGLTDPNARLVDLSGDGLSDILVTHDHHFLYYKSKGEKGYDNSEMIQRETDLDEFPNIYFNDPSGRIRLADMTGDGLSDIVMLHNGIIEYWPNLGYGKFGKKITMKEAPHLDYNFDPKRLFLADLDGSGTADLVYVGFDGINFWFNQSGNSWSEKQIIPGTPNINNLSAIQFADFYGTGTSCLVWSYNFNNQPEGNYKILDFCGGEKPNLLTEMSNNMGATTRVQYAPSTKFYLEDKKDGNPWVTNLPFPVQVLEKTEVIDHISKTKLVTTYKYHHGYYDGREREFRGFGRVDQQDTEYFDDFTSKGLHDKEVAFSNNEYAYHVPPVLTKNWFHTGVYFDENLPSASGIFYDKEDMMAAYRKEFYKGDKKAFQVGDHIVENTNTPHQAFRALRGAAIRSEVYALDGTEKEKHPYTVTENQYYIKQIQPKAENEYAVYLSLSNEQISYHYEKLPNDPRVAHTINLKYDDFGNPEESVAISYPRRNPQYPEQAETKAIYSFNRFINKPQNNGYYYIGPPCETKSFEVHGLDFQWPAENISAIPLMANDFKTIRGKNNYQNFEYEPPQNPIGLNKRIIEWSRQYYRTDDEPKLIDKIGKLSHRLDFGKVESMALPYGSYLVAFTSDQIRNTLPADGAITDDEFRTEGGYHKETANEPAPNPDVNLTNYWWIPTGRQSFNENLFYLSEEAHDPFGNKASICYDIYGLLMISAEDAVGNKIVVEKNDYRVLQPSMIKDPNDNYSQVAFDALGMVVGTASCGVDKDGNPVGDSLDDFIPDLEQIVINQHINDPLNLAVTVGRNPLDILDKASTRLIYDLKRYQNTGEPNVVYTLTREKHAFPETADKGRVQHSFLYSDGFGRELQSKIQAEPGHIYNIDGTIKLENVSPRWVGTGTKVYNNKGKAIQQYEPFFSENHYYAIEQHGVSPTIFYDPLERVVCTVHPNHTYEKVVFDPWRQETWDANDTIHPDFRYDPQNKDVYADHYFDPVNDPDVGQYFKLLEREQFWPTWYFQRIDDRESLKKWPDTDEHGNPLPESVQKRNREIRIAEKSAAQKASCHVATQSVTHLDCLGRVFLTIADNGMDRLGVDNYITNSVKLDIEGNDKVIIDPRQIRAFEHTFDLAGRKLKVNSKDAGTKVNLPDITGKIPWYLWDANGNEVKTDYDVLRRAKKVWVKKDGTKRLVNQTFYGDEPGVPNAIENNLKGKPYRILDDAGEVQTPEFDFKGNPLKTSRKLLLDYKLQVSWDINTVDDLEEDAFTAYNTYDALNRIVESKSPDDTLQKNTYNETGLLETVKIQLDGEDNIRNFVNNIDYNAKRQRELIEYGNSVKTGYTYENDTYRLSTLVSNKENGNTVQYLRYTYDPVGNITHLHDAAHKTVFNANQEVIAVNNYTYDAIYRLKMATGREHQAMTFCNYQNHYSKHTKYLEVKPQPLNNGHDIYNYSETYTYDESGNITQIFHNGNAGQRTRNQTYALESNRILTSRAGCRDENEFEFSHDSNGNILSMIHLPKMNWDYANRLTSVELNIKTNVTSDRAFYNYDAGRQRVRKVIEQGDNRIEERIYIGGYEIYRKYNREEPIFIRSTIHVMDDTKRIALIERKLKDTNPDPEPEPAIRVRYQLDNHLGSSMLEIDENGKEISYEEYYPHGGSAYQAGKNEMEVKLKRYRYSGKERDDETGLYYYGARYYIPWMGRWLSCDPEGRIDGSNFFLFVKGNPIKFNDLEGLETNREVVQQPSNEIKTDHIQITLYFAKNKESLNKENKNKISEIKDMLKDHSVAQVEGYSSTEGDPDYNLGLSNRRAEHVKKELGLDENANIKGLGEGGPEIHDQETGKKIRQHTEEGRSYYRRVVVILKKQETVPKNKLSATQDIIPDEPGIKAPPALSIDELSDSDIELEGPAPKIGGTLGRALDLFLDPALSIGANVLSTALGGPAPNMQEGCKNPGCANQTVIPVLQLSF